MSGHSSSNPIWQGLCSKTLRWVWRPNVAGRVLRMELAGSALGHFGTAGGKTNPAMPWNIFLHGTLNRWVIRGKGLCTDMFFFDITIVISGYEWNLSFETWKGFKSHHGLTISPCFFLEVLLGLLWQVQMRHGNAILWSSLSLSKTDSCRWPRSKLRVFTCSDEFIWWFKAMPIPGFSSPFWGMYGKNAVGHPPHKARKTHSPPPTTTEVGRRVAAYRWGWKRHDR